MMKKILEKYKKTHGLDSMNKVICVDDKYYWRLSTPGYPSKAYDNMLAQEVSRSLTKKHIGLRMIFLAITSQCPLQCEHCFEWERLNQEETYSDEELVELVKDFQQYPTLQVYFSGGEPLLRYQSILQVLRKSAPGTDFWIITSGLGLTEKKAHEFKASGLTGVLVSLDHHMAEAHNQFRGYDAAYDQAIKSAQHLNNAGLVSGLSLCATKDYTSKENLEAYMDLAKALGVTFVQILEPKATGRYQNKDVALSTEQIKLLETTYLLYNNSADYRAYPIIDYPGYHQRRVGCFGAGNRFFYIDSSGDAHVCPFCSNPVCNVKDHSIDNIVNLLSTRSCGDFQKCSF